MRTIGFVRKCLPDWRDDTDRPIALSEDDLNLQLCKFLDSRAHDNFPMVRFNREENQPKQRSVDLSASPAKSLVIGAKTHSIYDYFLVFECKRLPAPSNNRTREYVTGESGDITGGIQRFKLGLHGKDLEIVVMIGYVQKYSCSEWISKINSWILQLSVGKSEDGCSWTKDETLSAFEEDLLNGIATYRSTHNRVEDIPKDIKIYHLWVVMNSKLGGDKIEQRQ
jgi:hypothetical protein